MRRSTETGELGSDYKARPEHTIVGLMSGTSLDGVDAVLVEIRKAERGGPDSVRLLGHVYLGYPDELRERIARLCALESSRIDDLVYAHFGLSEWYAEAVLALLSKTGYRKERIDAISMHGQTVWHAPRPQPFPGPKGPIPVKGTLQIGSAAVVRERTGIRVVSDLRSADMAAGGEGAPLAPYIDYLLFGDPGEGRIVQNIGGIGNATVLPPGGDTSRIFAFDTGPGNMIIDAVVGIGTKGERRYDPEGSIAAKGRVSQSIVEELMRDPYFSRRPPKSTGREVYGIDFTRDFLRRSEKEGLSFEDAVATATAFTAESIARSYRDFVLPVSQAAKVIVAGGGALNATLLRMIRERLPESMTVSTSNSFGVPDQAREAMAFALLGHESLMGRPGNLPAVTGARSAVVLGQVTL